MFQGGTTSKCFGSVFCSVVCASPVALLVLLAAAAGAWIVAPHLGYGLRSGSVFLLDLAFRGEYRIEAMQPEPLIQSKHDQLGFARREIGQCVDFAKHSAHAPAGSLARH